MRLLLGFLILCEFVVPAYAAKKKDFKGLFGSYRRERFTENEANSTDFGFDLMLSTLLPVTPVVKSSEVRGVEGDPLYYAISFNFESTLFFTLAYQWEAFASFGYYGYETRKENVGRGDGTQAPNVDPAFPLFHQFEMSVIPVILGVKYRLSDQDIVPYVGLGAGMAFTKRKASYDYDTAGLYVDEDNRSIIAGEAIVGLEFFFAPRMGIRLEAAAFYLNFPKHEFDLRGSPANNPIFTYQPNVWSARYASGIFFLL